MSTSEGNQWLHNCNHESHSHCFIWIQGWINSFGKCFFSYKDVCVVSQSTSSGSAMGIKPNLTSFNLWNSHSEAVQNSELCQTFGFHHVTPQETQGPVGIWASPWAGWFNYILTTYVFIGLIKTPFSNSMNIKDIWCWIVFSDFLCYQNSY